jgi:aminoglycoside phosphotransferase (APT) family kinase protein
VTGPNGQPADRPLWAADREVDAALAAELISARFPELAGAGVRPLAEGWDNTVHSVTGPAGRAGRAGDADRGDVEWLFRFPRRVAALPGVQREIAALPRLAPRLPLPIPVPEYVGQPGPDQPWPFWGARRLPGSELAVAGLPEESRTGAAAAIGGFLRALHDPGLAAEAAAWPLDPAEPGEVLPVDPLNRATPSSRTATTLQRLADLERQGLYEPELAARELLAAAERLGPPPDPPAVSHGDLHIRHVLVEPDGSATAVIDFGDLCLADPAVDLSLAYAAFIGEARAALLEMYGPVPPERELRARAVALFLSGALAVYALDVGASALLAEALAGLRRAVR